MDKDVFQLACQKRPRRLLKKFSGAFGKPTTALQEEEEEVENHDPIPDNQSVKKPESLRAEPLLHINNFDGPNKCVKKPVDSFSVEPLTHADIFDRSGDWSIVMKDKWGEKRFKELTVIGHGGSGKVVRVLGEDGIIYALKIVDLARADRSVKTGFINEIKLLQQLKGSPHIISLIDYSWDKQSNQLLLLLEHGETDLAKMVQASKLTVVQIKTYWKDILLAVKAVQDVNIVHRDLKPANFVLVGNSLKLIDFGISSNIRAEVTSVMPTDRCGTISYMAPETLQDQGNSFKIGRYSDVWSLGCILYLLVYGYTPFHQLHGPVQKMLAIINPNYQIVFSCVPAGLSLALDVLQLCLRRNPKERPTIKDLLEHPFLHA